MDNTMDTLQIKIREARINLPEKSREVIDAIGWKSIISGMSGKYNSDQIDTLETETELLLSGLLKPEAYPKELETRMKISSVEANSLVNEIDKLVFKKIQKELESLINSQPKNEPNKLQNSIIESNWKENLYVIAQKHKLSISQMGSLEEITNKFLLGTINSDAYTNELKIKLGLPVDKNTELVNEINEKIVKNVREILKSHWAEKEKPVNTEDEVPVPPYAHPTTLKTESIIPASKTESGIYKNAGIEMINDDMVPVKGSANNIIASKLSGMTLQKPAVSDYSRPATLKQTPASAPPPPNLPIKDPYHEAI